MKFSHRIRRGMAIAIAALVLAPLGVVAATAPAAAADPLRREVSREKPLFITNFYKGGEGPDQTDVVTDLWGKIPSDLKENTVVMFIADESLKNIPSVTSWITAQADAAQAAGIPFFVQAVNGETPAAQRVPVSFFRTLAETHSRMQGVNAAELYNAASFTGSDHSDYLADLVQLSVDKGLHFVWTDTNILGTGGIQYDWLQNNATLFSRIRANPQNVIFMDKESTGDGDSDALNLGMWLSGSAGNWGSASDWWHWSIAGYGDLWTSHTPNTGGWKNNLQYPEAMTVQSMLKVVSQGGTAFKTEAQWFTNVTDGERLAPYEFAIIPFLRDLKSGAIRIPTKAEVLEQNKVVYKGSVYNDSVQWDFSRSNLFPKTGRYGLIPMVPARMPNSDLSMFENIATTAQNQAYFDNLYPQEALSSNTFLTRNAQTWYWMNYAENVPFDAQSSFVPRQAGSSRFSISAPNHTYAVMTESANTMTVNLNNYRLNKSNVYNESFYGVPAGADFDKFQTYQYIKDFMSVKLDANGDPVKDANGNVLTASNQTLKDRTPRDLRTTTFTVDGTWNGGRPQVDFAANTTATRPYQQTQNWDAANKRLTISITHNGLVKFSVKTNGDGGPTTNLAQGKTATQSSEWGAPTAGRAVDGNTSGVFGSGSVSHTDANGQTDPWWKVDLGGMAAIGEIEVWNRTDCCAERLTGAKVEVLDASNAVVWTKSLEGHPSPGAMLDTGGVVGRTVRITLPGANRVLALAEVKVRPAANNLARGKAATQSSEWGPLTAGRAVDGNTDGIFSGGSVTHTSASGQTDPWWRVDLGSSFPVGRIEVWNRTDCCSDRLSGYKVEVLDSANAVVWSRTSAAYPTPTDVLDAGGIVGRHVRVTVPGSGKIVSLAEVKVFSPQNNLAQGRTATQSSTYTGGDGTGSAAKAVDGNADGAFSSGSVSHTNTETAPWWRVDLGSAQPISEISIWNRTDCCSDRLTGYKVEVLDAAQQVVWSSSPGGAPAPMHWLPTGGVVGRYVKVSVPGTGKILALAEVVVR